MGRLTYEKLCEILQGVNRVTFTLDGVGEESYSSQEVYEVIKELQRYKDLEEQGYEMVNINNIITKLESHFVAEENILNMGGYLDAIKIVKDEVENGKTD